MRLTARCGLSNFNDRRHMALFPEVATSEVAGVRHSGYFLLTSLLIRLIVRQRYFRTEDIIVF